MTKYENGEKQQATKNAKILPQYTAAISACLGAIAAGAVLGWTANITNALRNGEFADLSVSDEQLGWIGSLPTLGAMVTCFPVGILCDLLGRKRAMLFSIIPLSLGWTLILFASNVDMIYAGRFFTGMGCGAFCVAAPLYTSEISGKEIRGTLGSFFQLFLVIGILIAYILPLISSPFIHTIVCSLLPNIFGTVFVFQSETPLYLIKKHKENEAIKSLRSLRGECYDIETEITAIKENLATMERNSKPFFEVINTTAARKASVICFSLMFFQQMCGVNAVIFYTGEIFTSAGVSLDSQVATLVIGAVQVVASFGASLFIDKLGRKILLLVSSSFMAVGLILLGIFFTLQNRLLLVPETIATLNFLPILALCVYIIAFSLGFGPIPWMINAELFPPEVKATATSAVGTFCWFLAFVVTKFYIDLNNAVGADSTFYIFSLLSLSGTIFVFFVVPETKGKSLNEIQELLSGAK